jgi:signal transduction histidine kinase
VGLAGADGDGWRRASVADALLAALCVAVAVVAAVLESRQHGEPDLSPWGVALLVAQGAPVALRRRRPVAVWLVTGLAALAYGVAELPDPYLPLGPLVAFYTVASDCPRVSAVVAAGVTALGIGAGLLLSGDADPVDAYAGFLVAGLAWVLGDRARTRRAYEAELEERAELLRRQREEEARRAVEDERVRIARELHDVVAHHVSMMVVQSEAGASVVAGSPDSAAGAFDSVAATGRQALAEMRRLLGVLRTGDRAGQTEPVPGIEDVASLVE